MPFDAEKRDATRLLRSLEDGSPSPIELRAAFEEADPVLLHALFAWLRARYPAHHPSADGVLGRIASLVQASPAVARKARAGASDPVVEWLEETYDYRELPGDELVSLVVEKLEG